MNEIIYSYTRQQALADGVLLRLEDFFDRHALEGELIVAALHHSPSTRFASGRVGDHVCRSSRAFFGPRLAESDPA